MKTCEHDGCTQPYETVDASFGFVCGLHREPIPLILMDTGRNLREVSPLDMTEAELDASMGDLLTAVAAKQSDVWDAQRDAAAWKALAEDLALSHLGWTDTQFREERRTRGLA